MPKNSEFGGVIDWVNEGLFHEEEDDVLGMEGRPARPYKTDEELAKFDVNPSFNDLEKAMYILKNGNEVQKMYVFSKLPNLLSQYTEDESLKLIPAVLEQYAVDNKKLLTTAHFIKSVLEQGLFPKLMVSKLVEISRRWKNYRGDSDIANGWFDVFIATVPYLQKELVDSIMIPDAFADAGITQASLIRQRGCKLFGAIAPRLSSKELNDTILTKCMNLCQDIDFEIRAAIAAQIPALVKSAGVDLAASDILPEFAELLADEDIRVREAAVIASMEIMNAEELDIKDKIMIPLWRLCCEEDQPKVRTLIIREFGKIVNEFSNGLDARDREFFLKYFLMVAQKGTDLEKEYCAYNLPAIILVLGNSDGTLMDGVEIVLESLASNENPKVRKCIAAGLVEMLSYDDCLKTVRKLFAELLADSVTEVSQMLWPAIETFLHRIATLVNGPKELDPLIKTIMKAEASSSNILTADWRHHLELLRQMHSFHQYFNHDTLFELTVGPLTAQLRTNTAHPIKREIISVLCTYYKHLRKQELRDKIFRNFSDLRDSRHFAHRMLYIDVCDICYDHFSHRFFRQKFFSGFTEAMNDRVPNIRLKCLGLMSKFRYVLMGNTNIIHPQKLGNALVKLLSEEWDKQLLAEINQRLQASAEAGSNLPLIKGRTGAEGPERIPYGVDELLDRFLLRNTMDAEALEADTNAEKAREDFEQKLLADEHGPDDGIGSLNSGSNSKRSLNPSSSTKRDIPAPKMKDKSKQLSVPPSTIKMSKSGSDSTGGSGSSLDSKRRPGKLSNESILPTVGYKNLPIKGTSEPIRKVSLSSSLTKSDRDDKTNTKVKDPVKSDTDLLKPIPKGTR